MQIVFKFEWSTSVFYIFPSAHQGHLQEKNNTTSTLVVAKRDI